VVLGRVSPTPAQLEARSEDVLTTVPSPSTAPRWTPWRELLKRSFGEILGVDPDAGSPKKKKKKKKKNRAKANWRREAAAEYSKSIGVTLETPAQRGDSKYLTPDAGLRVVCLVSKTHRVEPPLYWFGYRVHARRFLEEASGEAKVLFGCGSTELLVALPRDFYHGSLDLMSFNTQPTEEGSYWQIKLEGTRERMSLILLGGDRLNVTEYVVEPTMG
jgi:hypothetical protein